MTTPARKKLFDRRLSSVPPDALDQAVIAAIEKSASRHGIDRPLAGASAAVQVDSLERKSGLGKLFGKPKTVRCSAVLTPQRLWVAVDDGKGLAALALQLSGLEVVDYETTWAAKRVEDHGLDLTGFQPGASERMTYFLGLGSGAEADAFGVAVRAAVGLAAR